MVTIIVAYNQRGVIGNNLGKVPWHIPEDMKFFKDTTMGHVCIMGRKTWDSIPAKFRPLPGRVNIVVTRDPSTFETSPDWQDEAFPSLSVEQAIQDARFLCPEKEIFITGGGQIYNYCLDHELVDRVFASEINNHLDVEGATFFPNLKDRGWKEISHKEFRDFTVVEYRR